MSDDAYWTRQAWAEARVLRLHGMLSESCCEAERRDRIEHRLSETWRITPVHDDGAYELICQCGCESLLMVGMLSDYIHPFTGEVVHTDYECCRFVGNPLPEGVA